MSPLKGNSPVRGNVCEADKRVPVSGRKDVTKWQRGFKTLLIFSQKKFCESVTCLTNNKFYLQNKIRYAILKEPNIYLNIWSTRGHSVFIFIKTQMLYFCIHMPSVEVEIYVWRQLSYVFFVRSFDCALFYFCEIKSVCLLKGE